MPCRWKFIGLSLMGAIFLSSCDRGGGEPGKTATSSSSSRSIPAHWKKIESKDSFTDKITKFYNVQSNESSSHVFSVGCSKKGFLNFYVEYPERTGMPSTVSEVGIRIDGEPVHKEDWYVSWVSGSTTVDSPYGFFQKIKGKSKLAIEIFAATRNSYDISGVEQVVADMEATACRFEDKKIIKEVSTSEMPKFAAICKAPDGPPFILVTEPSEKFVYFSRHDRQYDPSRSVELKVYENKLLATILAPCCKDSPTKLEFNRQTGELKRQFSSGGGQDMRCERVDDATYESELAEAKEHYRRKVTEAEGKSATENSNAEQKRAEEERKTNQPNKF